MSFARVLPVLLLENGGLVKTENFKNPVYIGDPINAVRIFNEKEVDELLLLDITASKEEREPDYEWIRDIVSESFMPIGYGGGIKNLDQIKKLFGTGIEKVVLNTASFDFDLISKAAAIYGNQSISISIDVRRTLFGGYSVFTLNGTIKHKLTPDVHARQLVEAGTGEIIIQSIDHEGTMKGYDLELIKLVSEAVNVPVVASGGAGSLEHIREALHDGGASSAAAGSLFIYRGKHRAVLINYPTFEKLREII